MDSDGLPIIGAGIDFSKVEPIPHKRSLACINHFVMHTVSFLNRFSCVCEEKLEDLASRVKRLETTMNILEAKLSSIPGLEGVTVATTAQSQSTSTPAPPSVVQPPDEVNSPSGTNASASNVNGHPSSDAISNGETPVAQGTNSAANDPRYAKFFTLIKHGVPKEAVAPKMLMEGLDPSVLDNPSAPVPQAAPPPPAAAKSENKKDDSDLSDSDNQSDSLSDSQSSDEDFDD